jgi:SpoVK/Ycf46/Vps4 family AAA+-type ATPase
MDLRLDGNGEERPFRSHRGEEPRKTAPSTWKQWKQIKGGLFEACGATRRRLPSGAYDCRLRQFGEQPQLQAKDLKVDDLIDLADSLPTRILQEIERFWSQGDQFKRYGFLHRRGYLLYGPQGSGKSSVVHQIVQRIIQAGHVAIFCEQPGVFSLVLERFRRVEPDRPVVCVFEDIDTIIDLHSSKDLLPWLDGADQIDRVVNIATTNYPENLDPRVVGRPRRFDRIIKIEHPTAAMRQAYFRKKLPELESSELECWVKQTEGLSFAALAELVISVACLGHSLEDAERTLRAIEKNRPSSREFERAMGFSLNGECS